MTLQQKYRIALWMVVILAATNISMGLSYWYHRYQENKPVSQLEEPSVEIPAQQRTRFFREQLNLSPLQVDQFRDLNRVFNQNAWTIRHQLAGLRRDMVIEMGQDVPDEQRLDSISSQIGELHKQLKDETIRYYLNMKDLSDDEQQDKLHTIFLSVLEENEDLRLPQQGGRFRNSRQSGP